MTIDQNSRPKVFVSYSWSSHDHQLWVLDLAKRLTEANVHVLLDRWELQPGADAIHFMERMVNDPAVTKVLILADKQYIERANGRHGGVGTETQIISPELYKQASAGKFALVVCERDEKGHPFLPTYYNSKMYIDLSTEERYVDEFEKLLRWVYDKPADVRPPFGSTPSFLLENQATDLGTALYSRRAMEAVRSGKPQALGSFSEYLDVLASNLKRLRIVRNESVPIDQLVVDSFEAFKPFRNEFLEALKVVVTHSHDERVGELLHSFFERIHAYTDKPIGFTGQYQTADFDNFRLICHELFLLTIALVLARQCFALAADLLARGYYVTVGGRAGGVHSFGVLVREVESMEMRKRRLNLSRASLVADMFLERTGASLVSRDEMLQADFVLCLRSQLRREDFWYPVTHVYAGGVYRPFELFARASSKAFFDKLAPVLGESDVNKVKERLVDMRRYGDGFNAAEPTILANFEGLCTRA